MMLRLSLQNKLTTPQQNKLIIFLVILDVGLFLISNGFLLKYLRECLLISWLVTYFVVYLQGK